MGSDGIRQTVNKGLNEDETLWHFRSGWNVAALNCLDPEHEPILTGYGQFLRKYARRLTTANNNIDAQFRRANGSRNAAVKARESFMTQVYNYFALPPARSGFCDVAQQIANEFLTTQPEDPIAFASAGLPRIDAVYEQFFSDYERYMRESAAWDLRYGILYGASQPGYVAVHGSNAPGVGSSLSAATSPNSPQQVGEVVDPDSGAAIPVIQVPEDTVATPIVQPVATETPTAR